MVCCTFFVSVNLDLLQASVKRSKSVIPNPRLLCEITCLQVIVYCVVLFCNSSLYQPLHILKDGSITFLFFFFNRWTQISALIVRVCVGLWIWAGKDMTNTWLVPQLYYCETWYNMSHRTLYAEVWTDRIIDVSLELIIFIFCMKKVAAAVAKKI